MNILFIDIAIVVFVVGFGAMLSKRLRRVEKDEKGER